MRKLLLYSLIIGSVAAVRAGDDAESGQTNMVQLTTISLPDQYGRKHTFAFPQSGVSVLTVADRDGSEQIAAWVQPLKERFPEGLPIEGVADVSRVPRVLRPLVRKRFVEKIKHPVMLDWEGKVVDRLPCKAGMANVFLLSTNGTVLLALRGEATAEQVRQIHNLVVVHQKNKVQDRILTSNRASDDHPAAQAASR